MFLFLLSPSPSWVPEDRITKQENDAYSALAKAAEGCCDSETSAIYSFVFYVKEYLLRKDKKEKIIEIISGINVVAEISPLGLKYWEWDMNNFFIQLRMKQVTPVFISLANKTVWLLSES